MKTDTHFESLIKSILYRIFATISTILIAFIFTHDFKISISIGSLELFSKIILYYFYERIWLFFKKKTARGDNEQ